MILVEIKEEIKELLAVGLRESDYDIVQGIFVTLEGISSVFKVSRELSVIPVSLDILNSTEFCLPVSYLSIFNEVFKELGLPELAVVSQEPDTIFYTVKYPFCMV